MLRTTQREVRRPGVEQVLAGFGDRFAGIMKARRKEGSGHLQPATPPNAATPAPAAQQRIVGRPNPPQVFGVTAAAATREPARVNQALSLAKLIDALAGTRANTPNLEGGHQSGQLVAG